jgi:cohesin complex subunit SA-1/2
MPARLSSMEISEPDATSGAGDTTTTPANRRKSGRTIRKPDLFAEDNFAGSVLESSSAKRKRAQQAANANDDDGDDDEEVSEEETEDEADEEEIREKRRVSKQKKPAAKKQKLVNGTGPQLAIRPPPNRQKAPKSSKAKAPRVRKSQAGDANSLYGKIVLTPPLERSCTDWNAVKVFSHGQDPEEIVAEWLQVYNADSVQAVCDIVNFVLKCAGGELVVDVHDIEDVDNVTGRLADLQDEYQAQKIAEYPLISKNKQYVGFGETMAKFFNSLIATIHSANTLYTDSALIENIQTWVSTMSSAPIRPFRHTATVISLAIMNALCDVALELQTLQSNSEQQVEKEKKQRRVNKDRVTSMTRRVQEYKEKLETIDSALKDSFDTVFVHRYRDVDPRIRAECVTGLGYWISTYQSMFFEGTYLRYLGWVLSDTVPHTRAEVIKQLRSLFGLRSSVPRLRGFTERFRPRIVEMATKDADPAVRASAIELLDLVRDHGLLEPDDIDAIGQLIFDSEPRVRKAVAKFFVANITDVYDLGLEEVLKDETIEEYLPNDDDDDFESPKSAWIKFRCLATVLNQYDSEDGQEEPVKVERGPPGSKDVLIASGLDSRFTLATQAMYSHMTEIQHWEWLAGYLLFDHSQIPDTTDEDDTAAQLKALYKMEEGQEMILLEVLVSAVKLRLVQVTEPERDKKAKKSKGRKADTNETPESVARNLTKIIPQLLSKFGAIPAAASAVLRLEHLLNLDIVEELQQEPASYSSLLDKINEQFLGHSDDNVLAEASATLLRAKAHEELDEITEDKIGGLWNDTISSLRELTKGIKGLDSAETLPSGTLEELVSTASRISSLASISDPSEEFSKHPTPAKSKKSALPNVSALDILLQLTSRASKRTMEIAAKDEEKSVLEDSLAITSIKALTFQFMWSVRSVASTLSTRANFSPTDAPITFLADLSKNFIRILTALLQSRAGTDPVRLSAATTILDLHTLLATLRHIKPPKPTTTESDTGTRNLDSVISQLVKEIPRDTSSLITAIFIATEKLYAKKSHRRLESADDDPPEDLGAPEDEDEDEDAENDDEAAALLAEQSLCELTGKIVLGIIARVIDCSGSSKGKLRDRLGRNKGKLGHNFKAVLAYLDEPKEKRAKKGEKDKAKEKQKEAEKSETLVIEDDDIEDGEDDEDAAEGLREEEDGEDDLRRMGLIVEEDEGQRDEDGDDDAEGEGGGENKDEDEMMGD